MSAKKIAVIGAMGYGRRLIDEVLKNGKKNNSKLVAIVDVSKISQEDYSLFVSEGIKVYKTMKDMYGEMSIDLTLIASPIQFHGTQACFAMENGSHVMLEKPIAGCVNDAKEIIRVREETGKKILVGFQLIYDEAIRKTKKIILSGRLGRLKSMKCIVLWPRDKSYFNRNKWAGKTKDKEGKMIRDSVANNATAHHFMTLLYFAGADINSAGKIIALDAKLSKANDIETFDTCVLEAKIEGNIDMLSIASHATKSLQHPIYTLEFEKGYIRCEDDSWEINTEGVKEQIGKSDHNSEKKVWDMTKYIDDDNYPVRCTLECALEHTKMIEMINELPVVTMSEGTKTSESGQVYVEGLSEKLLSIYNNHI